MLLDFQAEKYMDDIISGILCNLFNKLHEYDHNKEQPHTSFYTQKTKTD